MQRNGVEFLDGGNHTICADATIRVQRADYCYDTYKVLFHPDFGKRILKESEQPGKYETLVAYAKEEDIVAILPPQSVCKFEWTYSAFMLALTFFGEGLEKGYKKAEQEFYERDRRKTRNEGQPA